MAARDKDAAPNGTRWPDRDDDDDTSWTADCRSDATAQPRIRVTALE